MRHRSQRKEIVEFIDDVTCDKCEASLKGDIGNVNGLVTSVYGGFDSTALNDGVRYDFDVCEKCLVEWFKTFKRQPRETGGI